MPNGGSDCCGTCWYNAKNKGEAGYDHARDTDPDFCTIRKLEINHAFYTYCCNHPQRRPERDPIPIGPVFTGDSSGNREILVSSPETEEVRKHLLELLAAIKEKPESEYPMGYYTDEIVVWQLGEFREVRAVERLKIIAGYNCDSSEDGPFGRTRENLIELAEKALQIIHGGPA